MKSGIYAIVNRSNNKVYVGQSVDIQNRWKQHKRELSQGIHHNVAMQNDYNKGDKFDFQVLCYCVDLDDQERFYINKYDSYRNGYNQTRGGSGNNQDPLNLPSEKSTDSNCCVGIIIFILVYLGVSSLAILIPNAVNIIIIIAFVIAGYCTCRYLY